MSKEYGKEFEPPESKGGSVPLTKGNKMKFKVGDRVRHVIKGECTIKELYISELTPRVRLVSVLDGCIFSADECALTLIPQYKTGDTVWVRDGDKCDWVKRVFVCEYEGGYWVIKHSSGQFLGDSTSSNLLKWKQIKPLEEKLDIALTCTVNGEEVPLSDISEETLLAIRNKSK